MQIRVKSVSRLHFGFLDLTGDLGRLYGSIGVALENPKTVITATEAEELIIENGDREKMLGFVEKFSKHYRVQPTADSFAGKYSCAFRTWLWNTTRLGSWDRLGKNLRH